MKKLFLLSTIVFVLNGAFAQTWLWPMAGHKAGENIISQPGSNIKKDFNCCNIFIGGKAGDVVLCPVDGVLQNVDFCYNPNMHSSYSYSYNDAKTWDENYRTFNMVDNVDKQYISGSVCIKIADGRKVYISGILGPYRLVKGQKVSAGDTLGTLAWSSAFINKPSLNFSVSLPNTTHDDPMKPFGLESKFHLEKLERDDPVSVEKMREDLTVLEKAMLELYPSLNERMSDNEFHVTMDLLRQSVTEPVPQIAPLQLIWFCHFLHDSHMTLLDDRLQPKPRDFFIPSLYYSWVDDTMRVVLADKQYDKYIGRVIKSIGGVSPREYAEQSEKYYVLYDNDVQSKLKEDQVFLSNVSVLLNYDSTASSISHIVFDDGEEIDIPFRKYPFIISSEMSDFERINKWRMLNRSLKNPDSVYTTRQLNDSTAYLSIKTFDISETKLERLVSWIGHCKAPNMIIDMRNNPGGDPLVLNRLLACFAQQPFNRQKGSHLYVNKRDNFESMRYIQNHIEGEPLFTDYVQLEGKPGYYCFDTVKTSVCIMPDTEHQYTGKVYVLTNGNSLSCATVFPAVLVRNRRGVSVGRETGSAYHYITALETADIQLPNTMRIISIPLVKVVFDTTVCDRAPWGRGLLPDYELPLTYNEVLMGADGETDVMLEYALQLIADGKYLSEEDPFAELDAAQNGNKLRIWLLVGMVLVGAVVVFIVSRICKKIQAENMTI